MAFTPDWTQTQPEHRWEILRCQSRFALWALFSSIGGMMTGIFLFPFCAFQHHFSDLLAGFDWGVSSNAASLPAFQIQFGKPYPTAPSGYIIPANYLSGWSGAASGGDIVGILIAGQLIEWVGRKHSLLIGSVITAIGVGMQIGSSEWILFLCGRLVNGTHHGPHFVELQELILVLAIGFGIVYILSPVWIGETVRPELRGFYLCFMNGSIVFGQLLLAVVAKGISTIDSHWSYRILIILQLAFVVPLLVIYPWFPESPYYLFKRGKPEKARKALNRIHGSSDQALIDAEMHRIRSNFEYSESLRMAAAQDGTPLLVQCFKGPNLRRTLIAILPTVEQVCVGSTFVLGFITYFMSLLEIHDFFTVTVVLSVVMLLSSMAAFPLIEAVGRRQLLIPGTFSLTAALLVMGITGCFSAKAAVWVFLVSVFLWAIVYQATLGAIGFAFGAEIPSLPLRSSSVSLMGFSQMAGVWVVSVVLPYLINPDAANLGAKLGFIFFGLSLPVCVLMYFYIPETKGLTFEELDYLFVSKTSCRKFQTVIKERRMLAENALEIEVKGAIITTKASENGARVGHIENSTV
ncbi:hypothetical protein A1O1_08255 [Capronia coronata CBS 617.96]|uniref:Major facilitator superfamily (MFS) profile domain-containing protein n=1 Tax=Capronia coronata CBS 617.96 TaxID=1182541 RepID=W9XIR5_9EURO|nr:uncharacterized protein A1O1_08255 [Capronia coronata CBS 617.96]EXJ80113.1 hypothetical protein A1O1_08255 [Capronia coronata CBS 617.96]